MTNDLTNHLAGNQGFRGTALSFPLFRQDSSGPLRWLSPRSEHGAGRMVLFTTGTKQSNTNREE